MDLVAIFDRSDEATLASFLSADLSAFSSWVRCDVDFGSLGLSRNAGVRMAQGDYIWTADADDLVSSNALIQCIHAVEVAADARLAVFPEYMVSFGGLVEVARYVTSSDLTPADFAFQHPFFSRIFVRREVLLDNPYREMPLGRGFAYEDWDLNNRLFEQGFSLEVASDSILFYRRRPDGLLASANKLDQGLTPHSKLFSPRRFLELQSLAERRDGGTRRIDQKRSGLIASDPREAILGSSRMRELILQAVDIDHEIDPGLMAQGGRYLNVPASRHWGFQLGLFFALTGDEEFTDVLLVPDFGAGGAEKYILQVLDVLRDADERFRLLVISGGPSEGHDWIDLLPENSVFVDLYNSFPLLDDESRSRLLCRGLLALGAPTARMHIKESPFSQRVIRDFGRALKNAFAIIYYRFSDPHAKWNNRWVPLGGIFSFLREFVDVFDFVVSDHEAIRLHDQASLGPLLQTKHKVIYARQEDDGQRRESFEARRRILWASRIADEKRPALISSIAKKLRSQGLDVPIDIYGRVQQTNLLEAIKDPGINYCGEFASWSQLQPDEYDVFLYTSLYDGLPYVILEALGSGMFVIAPNIGGIGEVLEPGISGFLVDNLPDDEELAAEYVSAIVSYYEGNDLSPERDRLRRQALLKHSQTAHRDAVLAAFGPLLTVKSEQS